VTTANQPDEAAARVVTTATAYLQLIAGDSPRDLVLLRQLRGALADLYAALVRVPLLGWVPATTTWQEHVETTDAHLEHRLLFRLPSGLYWSALRPLTHANVANTGSHRLAQTLGYIAGLLERTLFADGGTAPAGVLYGLGLEMDELMPPILWALTVIEEVVLDLVAYERQ
jgi:hypothetical protein